MEAGPCRVHKLVADVSLITHGKVLLARYQDVTGYDGEKGWFLPDDFLRHAEHPEDAAKRILQDQAGVAPTALRLSHIESFEGHGYWHLIFHYVASAAAPPVPTPGKNVQALEWFPIDKLPAAEQVAHGGWALETLQEILRTET